MLIIKARNLSIVLATLIALSGCSLSTEELAKEVQSSMEVKFAPEGIRIESLHLSHKGGNEYRGVLETVEPDGEFTYSVEVIFDGKTITWEITSHR